MPIFILIGFDVLFEKIKHPGFKIISDLTLYFLAPCLIFAGFLKASAHIAALFPRALTFMVVMTLIFWGLSFLFGQFLKLDGEEQSAFSLATIMMMNTGNYGLPLVLFAYGPKGLAYGVIDMAGQAAIPGFLILLGMQLARTHLRGSMKPVLVSSFLRLILSPIIAFLLCLFFHIIRLSRQVLILQPRTPSAIIPLLYAVQYDTHLDMVAGNILVSTHLSAATMTGLLYFLGA